MRIRHVESIAGDMAAYDPPTLIDKSPSVATAVLILLVLSLIVFPLRVYTRLTNKAWGTDDTLMSAATVCGRSDQQGALLG